MPKYQSVGGKWIPVDEAAKKICEDRGVDFLGAGVPAGKPTVNLNVPEQVNTGVLATPTFPKVATGKMDGTQVAEPTPAQKIKLEKKNK